MWWATLAALALIGCNRDKCDPNDPEACKDGLVCEEVEGDEHAHCFEPVRIEGEVIDLADESPVADARVVALDANGAPQTAVAVTDADGAYSLQVPTKRDAEGLPLKSDVTLRADAAGYVTFPSGVRQPLPIDVSEGTDEDGAWVLANATTAIGLIRVPVGTGKGVIAGTIEVPEERQGALVAAEIGGVAHTAVADIDGDYVIYNLDAGSYGVAAYAKGVVYESATADVTDGETSTVDLSLADGGGGTVSGNVQIVNAPGGSSTSVILVLESTFDDLLLRGETPPGLRAGGVSGDYAIEGVPPGRWVVLGAFENDGLVRDPDTSIGGTEIQHISVSEGGSTSVEGFKITGALEVTSPGDNAPEAVTSPPALEWLDDSSEDQYEIEVFDAYGQLVWETMIEGVSGEDPSVPYAGPLERGMYYQFRVTSIKDGVPISRTEDLKGVFWYDGD
jgi:hypothetical protein